MKTENVNGILYSLPEVTLLQDTGLGVAELAGRTAYDSFHLSENPAIVNFNHTVNDTKYLGTPANDKLQEIYLNKVNDITGSKLLESLAWVHHHHSVLELVNLQFLIKGTSRGVLQEHARHRMQSLTVKSTRYTLSNIFNAFVSTHIHYNEISLPTAKGEFNRLLKELDLFVIQDPVYIKIETDAIYDKLSHQALISINNIYESMLSKEGLAITSRWRDLGCDNLFEKLQKAKKKRNAADSFKHIVTDNFKVDMIVSFNLRSLKNYFDLRESNSAWFQIRWLAQEMIKATPRKYLSLILKRDKIDKILTASNTID